MYVADNSFQNRGGALIREKALIRRNTVYNFSIQIPLCSCCSRSIHICNLQDSYGDTALHDAIGKDSLESRTKESQEIVEMLTSVTSIDFSVKNKRGFNLLHHAALKGNTL